VVVELGSRSSRTILVVSIPKVSGSGTFCSRIEQGRLFRVSIPKGISGSGTAGLNDPTRGEAVSILKVSGSGTLNALLSLTGEDP